MSRRPVRRGSAPEDWKPGPRGRSGGVAQRLRRRPPQGVAPTDARADRPLGNPSSHRRPPDGFAGSWLREAPPGPAKPRLTPRSPAALKTQEPPLNLRRRKETPLPISGLFEG